MKSLKSSQVLTIFPILYSFIALFKGAGVADAIMVFALACLPLLSYWIEYKQTDVVEEVPEEIKTLESNLRLERLRFTIEETRLHNARQKSKLDEERARNASGPKMFTF